MTENKNDLKRQPSDYKERFEFRLYVGSSIIIQRYFRIINFNQSTLSSIQLKNTIDYCASLIDEDLKSKSRIYSWYIAPQIFENEKEMREWVAKPENAKRLENCTVIYLREKDSPEFIYRNGELIQLDKKLDDGEFTQPLTEADSIQYRLSFLDNGREVISKSWEGMYPKYIRRNVDLTNRRGRFNEEDLPKLPFESQLMYHLVEGKQDLVSQIVKEICLTCSSKDVDFYWNGDNSDYSKKKGSIKLSFNPYANYKQEIKEAYKYQRQNGMGRISDEKNKR